MRSLGQNILLVISATFGLGLLLAALGVLFGPYSLVVLMAVGFFYGWMLFAYLHYQQGRQEEFLRLLATVADSGVPLAPALNAYLRDRPRGSFRESLVAVLLFFVFPGYYWLWHRRHSFDAKVESVARKLEFGMPLSVALYEVPGVASRDTRLAVAVGESTGDLAGSLRVANPAGLATVWLEVMPRFVYPPLLLLFVTAITAFMAVFILPKLERIFADFKLPLPLVTRYVGVAGRDVAEYGGVGVLALPAGMVAAVVLLSTTTPLWYVPGLGRIVRLSVQSRVLRMLAVLLQAGRPAPEALAILARSETLPAKANRLLGRVRRSIESGQSLADSLRAGGLLQASFVPLVHTAERVQTLPRTLAELGEGLAVRLARLLRRASLVVLPASLVGVGVIVAAVGLSVFLPLIRLLSRLSE